MAISDKAASVARLWWAHGSPLKSNLGVIYLWMTEKLLKNNLIIVTLPVMVF